MKKLVLLLFLISVSFSFAKDKTNYQKAVFAGGCFWCLESDFDYFKQHLKSGSGIINVVSGYDGGKIKNPSYKLVSSGRTKYKEVVQVTFDPDKIHYDQLVRYFYRRIDPTDAGGQFCDRGDQYKSAIYYTSQEQKEVADTITKELSDKFKQKNKKINVYTEVIPSTHFYTAEEYHQDFHSKNPKRYCYYRTGCGRDKTIKKVWYGVDWKYSKVLPFFTPNNAWSCAL